jgi:septin family protein
MRLMAAIELELDEEGTRISLTIVDTPGFGDQIDNEARYEFQILRRKINC